MLRVCHFLLCGVLVAGVTGCGGLNKIALSSPKSGFQRTGVFKPKPRRADSLAQAAAAHAHYAAGVIHELNGENEAAMTEFMQAAQADPANEWLMLEISGRLVHQRKLDQAAQLLERAAGEPDVTGPVLARLAMVYSQLGRTVESQKMSREAIRRAPDTLAAYQNLFVNFMQAKQPANAIEALDAAAKVPKPSPEFLIGLSELYVTYVTQAPTEKSALYPKALALLKKARNAAGTDPLLKLKIADGFTLLGEAEAAAEVYTELLDNPASLPVMEGSVHARLANIYLRTSNKEKAEEQLGALIKADPTNPQPYYFMGHLLYDQGRPADAAEYFSKTVLLNPDFQQAYYDLASAQLAMDKASEALATLDKAREKFTPTFQLEFFSAVAGARLKDYDRALKHFTAAEVIANATDPGRLNHIFYFQLGVAYEQKKDYDQAAAAFEKCLKLSPEFTDAMNYLGYMWADLGTNLDRAVELLEKAVKAEPENAAYLDSLGWALFKRNRFEEAFDLVSKAVEISEEPDPVLFDHLGDICSALGREDQAREAWEKSLKLEASPEIKAKVEALKKEE